MDRHGEERSEEAIERAAEAAPECSAAAQRHVFLSVALGGAEGLAMTLEPATGP